MGERVRVVLCQKHGVVWITTMPGCPKCRTLSSPTEGKDSKL
jgi:hypothetical protein